jgi:EAL domain-containing protein (putative c-di-GMP-specific phosphodiesterase class I)
MVFQPIVDLANKEVFAYEALVRGLNGEGAYEILSKVNDDNRYQFDQQCRIRAIELAAQLKMPCFLSINFLPNAVYRPEACIRSTLEATNLHNFSCEKIIFEVTESEPVRDPDRLSNIFHEYRNRGFITAIDDFGAGHAGLNLLANFQPHIIKLDMALIRDIDSDRVRSSIVKGVASTMFELGIKVIAEGVETRAELATLRAMGVTLFQGYLFARPAIELLASVPFEEYA